MGQRGGTMFLFFLAAFSSVIVVETQAQWSYPYNSCAFPCENGNCNSLGLCNCETGWRGVDCTIPNTTEHDPYYTDIFSYFNGDTNWTNNWLCYDGVIPVTPVQTPTGALRLERHNVMYSQNAFVQPFFVLTLTAKLGYDGTNYQDFIVFHSYYFGVQNSNYGLDWNYFTGSYFRISEFCGGVYFTKRPVIISAVSYYIPPNCTLDTNFMALTPAEFANMRSKPFRIQIAYRAYSLASFFLCTVGGCLAPFTIINGSSTLGTRSLDNRFGVAVADNGVALDVYEFYVKENAQYLKDYSFLFGKFAEKWDVTRTSSGSISDPTGAVRLVPAIDTSKGAMWTKNAIPTSLSRFTIKVIVDVGNDVGGNFGRGFGVFLATNSSRSASAPFGIDSANFIGVGAIIAPAFFSSCFLASSTAANFNTTCGGSGYLARFTDLAFNFRTKLLVNVTITAGANSTSIMFRVCTTWDCRWIAANYNTNLQQYYTVPWNLMTIGPLYLGVGAYSDSNMDSVDLREIKTYTPDDSNIWTNDCKNWGYKTDAGTCVCSNGWTGSDCSQAICSPSCTTKNRCVAPNLCVCNQGWGNPPACNIPKCIYDCPLHAVCVAPNTCQCIYGWTRWDCSISIRSLRTSLFGSNFLPEMSVQTPWLTTNWDLYQPPSLDKVYNQGGIQPNGALRLAPSSSSNRGALWNHRIVNSKNLMVVGTVEIGQNGVTGQGFSLALVTQNSVIKSTTYTAGTEYMIKWLQNMFQGIAVNFQPALSQICVPISSTSSNAAYSSGTYCLSSGVQFRRKFEFTVRFFTISIPTIVSIDICTVGGCLTNISTTYNNPIPGIDLFLGIAAENDASTYDSFDVFELQSSEIISCPSACPAPNFACSSDGTCTCQYGYAGSDCSSPACPNAPEHSVCTAPFIWSCATGWTGYDCATPLCSNPVPQFGVCTAPNTITCISGWAGPSCANFLLKTPYYFNTQPQQFTGGSLANFSTIPSNIPIITYYGSLSYVRIASSDSIINGALLSSTNVIDNSDFAINVTVAAKKSYVDGGYYAIFVLRRESTYATNYTGDNSSTINWQQYSGLGVYFFPKTGKICVTYATAPWYAMTYPMCQITSPVTVNLAQKVRIGILSKVSSIWLDICSVTGCQNIFSNFAFATASTNPNANNNRGTRGPGMLLGINAKAMPNFMEAVDVYELQVAQIPYCNSGCVNGGTCIANGVCLCAYGWTGATCATPMCSPNCSSHGTCTLPNTCTCTSGWLGLDCSLANCTAAPCLNGGTCSSPNTCNCTAGWLGVQCQIANCSSLGVCQNGGSCAAPNQCWCPSGFTGSPTCDPGSNTCSPSCSSNGYCSGPNICTCLAGWTGATCSEAICSLTCSNGGICITPYTCSCSVGWLGDTCTSPYCDSNHTCAKGTCAGGNTCTCSPGWTGSLCDAASCSDCAPYGGVCTEPEVCTCNDGWGGDGCATPICDPPCQNNGNCTSPGNCTCNSHWTDAQCSTPLCLTACLNGGNCTAPDTCSCVSGYTNTSCQSAVCTSGCLHGVCTSPDVCTCSAGWTGNTCSTPVCDTIHQCQNGGTCSNPNTCNCGTDWTGANCTTPICSVCFNGGTCAQPEVCNCTVGWAGSDCSHAICNTNPCLYGNCTLPNVCTCWANYTGPMCSTPVCQPNCTNGICVSPNNCSCATGWTGSICQTPICSGGCLNNGNCSAPGVCNCAEGWSGSNCSHPNCDPTQCQNGGICSTTSISCNCTAQWTGPNCTIPICSNPSCLNGGTCVSPDQCNCTTGWTNNDCSVPSCTPACANNGTCASPNACSCSAGWTGLTCSTATCQPSCANNGNCTSPNKCTCAVGWTGISCTTPICTPPCANGGTCVNPNTCSCMAAWTGANCSISACNETCANNGTCIGPNTCSCSPQWTGAKCLTPVCVPSCLHGNCTAPNNCSCLSGWTGQACDSAICSATCLNGGYCTSPDYCTCVVGFNGSICELSVTIAIASIMTMTDSMIIDHLATVGNVVNELASGIAQYITLPAVVELFSGMDSLLDRLAKKTDISPNDFVYITQAFSTAADTVMQSATNGSEPLLALDIDDEGSMKCQIESDSMVSLTSQPSKPTLTKDQLRGVFDSFMSMLVSMFSGLKSILRPGTNMSFNGQFYGATVFNIRLNDLPSFKVKTNLASVEFDSAENPFDLLGPIPAACSQLQRNDIVHLVLSAFLVNAYDADRPFNMPTVAIRLYCDEKNTITNNPAYTLKVSAIPSVKKAALFSTQKKDSQCDISKLKCDLTDNVDRISSFVNFNVVSQAGDFVLIFPVIEFSYFAYIAIGSAPTPKMFHWLANVTKSTASLKANCSFTNPRHFYNTTADLRIIIPQSAVKQFQTTQKNNKNKDQTLSISVLIKRDFSVYPSLDDLPPSACDLQRCYGYQLSIGLAKGQSELPSSRRKRSLVDESSAEGFELDPSSSESAVVFKSKYFGDFGADLVIQPNTIEFSNIFANFSQLVAENSAVLAFQVATIVFFIVGVLVLFKFDRDDLKEWAFLPILSNQPFHSVEYLVSVHHSNLTNSELGPNVSLRLIGKDSDTCWRLLEDGVRKKNFKSKRPANFILKTQLSLGIIEGIELKLESKSVSAGKQTTLHIDRIVVVDVQQGLRYIFLAKSKLHHGQELKVELATEDEIKGYTYLVTGHSRASLTEIHPWLSIAQRPLPSNWTRCERLGCVISALFMAMLVNAMFYGKEATSPSVGVKVGPWFRISWFTVWTSFVGCLIIIPPTAVIAFIFKKVKRRSAEKSEWKTVLNLNIEQKCDAEKLHLIVDEKLQTQKKPFVLPFKCVAIAWILVAVCIAVPAAMVVLFSLEWGQSKSLQWLSGMMISVIQDIILIQPIKVILSAIVDATIHNLPNDGLGLGMLIYHQNTNKQKIKLFYRLRGVIIGIAHHLIYALIFASVIGVMTNKDAYIQVVSLRAITMVPGIDQSTGTVGDYSTVYEWVQGILLPNLKWNTLDRNGVLRKPSHLYSVLNPNVALLGPIRLRQLRVNQMKCDISKPLGRILSKNYDSVLTSNETCQVGYSNAVGIGSSTEKRAFHGNWSLPLDNFYAADLYNLSCYDAPWIYRESDEGLPYAGWEAVYNTGGYFVDLPKNFDEAESLLSQLKQNRWLDNATSVLFVDFNLFNAQTNLFIPIKVVFESLSAGGMSYHARLFPLQLYQYSGASSTLVFVVQAIWLILLMSQLVKLIIMFKKHGCLKFARNAWNVLDTSQVILGFGVTGLFAARIYAVITAVTKIQTLRSSFVSLDHLANSEDLIFCLLGVQFFLTMIVFFRHLSINKHWAVLLGTLSNGKGSLVVYGLAFSYATILFAAIGYLIMGFTSQNFKSFTMAMFTLIQGLIGTVDFASVKYSSFYLFLMMAYNAVVIFFGGNLFITIILSSHRDVLADIEKRTEWDAELSAYLGDSIRGIIRKITERSKKPSTEVGDIDPEKLNFNGTLERLANYLEASEKNFRNDVAWSLELKSYLCNESGELSGIRRPRPNEHLEYGAYVDGFPSIRSNKTQTVHNTTTLNKPSEQIVANYFKN